MGRLGLVQRSKHAGQQLHARLLSLVFVPTSRFNAEIDWRGRKVSELSGGLWILRHAVSNVAYNLCQRRDWMLERRATPPPTPPPHTHTYSVAPRLKDKTDKAAKPRCGDTNKGTNHFLAYMAVQWARIFVMLSFMSTSERQYTKYYQWHFSHFGQRLITLHMRSGAQNLLPWWTPDCFSFFFFFLVVSLTRKTKQIVCL